MPSDYQVALVNASVTFENILDNKQTEDAVAGDIANALLEAQITEATALLNADAALVQSAATAGSSGSWTTSESSQFNLDNSIYQSDTAVCQTGQNNASTAVQQLQTQVSQDGTDISNAISVANVLVQIGQYASNFLKQAYTAT